MFKSETFQILPTGSVFNINDSLLIIGSLQLGTRINSQEDVFLNLKTFVCGCKALIPILLQFSADAENVYCI